MARVGLLGQCAVISLTTAPTLGHDDGLAVHADLSPAVVGSVLMSGSANTEPACLTPLCIHLPQAFPYVLGL